MLHTMTITHEIDFKQHQQLMNHFNLPDDEPKVTKYYVYGFNEICLINTIKESVKYYSIDVRLNPRVLIEEKQSIFTVELNHIDLIAERFNYVLSTIITPSIDLGDFCTWTCQRIDYTVDIFTSNVKTYIKLFNKGDIPANFNWLEKVGSFYVKSLSVNINFYDKENELTSRESATGVIESALNLLRFEVQCKKTKTNNLKTEYDLPDNKICSYLRPDISRSLILYYYDKTIGIGDYYTLKAAIERILNSNYNTRKKTTLISTLRLIAQAKSVYKARIQFEKGTKINNINPSVIVKGTARTFNSHLVELRELSINPVTIPQDWGIEYLPNLREQILAKFDNIKET